MDGCGDYLKWGSLDSEVLITHVLSHLQIVSSNFYMCTIMWKGGWQEVMKLERKPQEGKRQVLGRVPEYMTCYSGKGTT